MTLMNDMTVRPEILSLENIGRFPGSSSADFATVQSQEKLLGRVSRPVTDDEARILVNLFGTDDYFGLAWSVLHLVESAPGWPLMDCLKDPSNPWIAVLINRCRGN